MELGLTLRQSWRITRNNRWLWWLGFLVALGSLGNGGLATRALVLLRRENRLPVDPPVGENSPDILRGLLPNLNRDALDSDRLTLIIGLMILVAVLAVLIWSLAIIARGGLIGATNQIQDSEPTSISIGWQTGDRAFWRLVGVGLVQMIPLLTALTVLIALMAAGASTYGRAGLDLSPAQLLASGARAVTRLLPLLGLSGLAASLISIVRPFADRACLMEDQGVIMSYRRGWEVLRNNLSDSIFLAITRLAIQFVIRSIVATLFIGLLIVAFAGWLVAIGVGNLTYATFANPLIVAILLAVVVQLIAASIVNAITTTYFSTLWTLAYRQFTDMTA